MKKLWKIFLVLATANIVVWFWNLNSDYTGNKIYFLDVGEGDSELILFANGAKVLIDTGPDSRVGSEIEKILGRDKYIDLVILTHNQKDHVGGMRDLLSSYRFGAVIFNGKMDSQAGEIYEFITETEDQKIPVVSLGMGDVIRVNGATLTTLSPDLNLLSSKEENDTGLVELLSIDGWKALFASDIGMNIESYLIGRYDLESQILKVGHHGSKYSSGQDFLSSVKPKISVVEVGANNMYGHPTQEALSNLENAGSKVLRTDQNGTIEIELARSSLRIFADKP